MLEILNEPSVRTFAPFALAALGAVVGVASVRIVAWLHDRDPLMPHKPRASQRATTTCRPSSRAAAQTARS